MEKSEKRITIRFPFHLWKRLKLAQIDSRISNINLAVLEGTEKLLDAIDLIKKDDDGKTD